MEANQTTAVQADEKQAAAACACGDHVAQVTALPALGQALAGGKYAGITTGKDGAVYALIVLDDKPSTDLNWKAAMAWAESLGDGASLPNRVEGAMLFANLKSEFDAAWHWTNEAYDSSYAWVQHFTSGGQDYGRKRDEFRARAVRRLVIQSLVI